MLPSLLFFGGTRLSSTVSTVNVWSISASLPPLLTFVGERK
jgi:hypothetical protein